MADKKSDILTRDENHLALIENGIVIDNSLLKFRAIKEELARQQKEKERQMEDEEEGEEEMFDNDTLITPNMIFNDFKHNDAVKKLIQNYDKIKLGKIRDVNIFISDRLFNDVFSGFNTFYGVTNAVEGNRLPSDTGSSDGDSKKKKKKRSVFEKLSNLLRTQSSELDDLYSIGVLEFFSQVKGLTKTNKDSYVNRLSGYIVALKNCDVSGQTALKEKLVRDMVINKYESVLYANDRYYVVTEQQNVDFVKKTEKGVRLTYVKNYMRVIPPEVIQQIEEANKLEIFDNYAVLHYDPDCLAYSETIEEVKKRKDPILFGLIRGSNKLYYITDWIDEYCDLTLDKFVETLQIEKESLKMPDSPATE